MTDLGVLCHLKILKNGTTGYDTALEMVDTESLEILHSEMLQKFLFGRLFGIYPVVELESKELTAEVLFKLLFAVALKDYLFR